MGIGIQQWKQRLQNLERVVKNLGAQVFSHAQQERHDWIRVRLSIFRLQTQLSTALQRMSAVFSSSRMLNAQQRTLLHWTGVYAQKVEHTYLRQIDLMGKEMWLKLLRARVPGMVSASEQGFSDDQVVEISVRIEELKKFQSAYEARLKILHREQVELNRTYTELNAIKANRDAAQTLPIRLSESKERLFSSKLFGHMAVLFRSIARSVQAKRLGSYEVQSLSSRLNEEADAILKRCRGLVLQGVRYPKMRYSIEHLAEFEKSRRQIEQLLSQCDQLGNGIAGRPPVAHPVFVNRR